MRPIQLPVEHQLKSGGRRQERDIPRGTGRGLEQSSGLGRAGEEVLSSGRKRVAPPQTSKPRAPVSSPSGGQTEDLKKFWYMGSVIFQHRMQKVRVETDQAEWPHEDMSNSHPGQRNRYSSLH